MHLADEAHIGRTLDRDVGGLHPGLDQVLAPFRLELAEHGVDGSRIEALGEFDRQRTHHVEGKRRSEEAERGSRARGRRDDDLLDAEHAGDIDGMRRTGAAEADHGVMARVLALLDEMDAGGGAHAFDHDLVDAPGRFLDREAERRSNRRDGLAGRLQIKRHAPAQEETGIVIAEHEIGVGHGRLGAAHAVAGRTGIGAGRMRADLEQPDLVDRRDRAAAGTDLDHVDDGRLDRQAGALGEAVDAAGFEHRRDLGAAVLDHAGLGGGAAHVE